MPRLAIRPHVHLSPFALNAKNQNAFTVTQLDEFLTFGLHLLSFEFSPQQVLQATLAVKVVDLNGPNESCQYCQLLLSSRR